MLKKVAEVLSDNARTSDVVGRWGGEEFLIVMPNTSEAQAAHLARRLRVAIEDACIGSGTLDAILTVSIGVSGAGPENPAEAPNVVVKCADEALYDAKERGRNRVEENFVEVAVRRSRRVVFSIRTRILS